MPTLWVDTLWTLTPVLCVECPPDPSLHHTLPVLFIPLNSPMGQALLLRLHHKHSYRYGLDPECPLKGLHVEGLAPSLWPDWGADAHCRR